jgi:hypothetical protein
VTLSIHICSSQAPVAKQQTGAKHRNILLRQRRLKRFAAVSIYQDIFMRENLWFSHNVLNIKGLKTLRSLAGFLYCGKIPVKLSQQLPIPLSVGTRG